MERILPTILVLSVCLNAPLISGQTLRENGEHDALFTRSIKVSASFSQPSIPADE